MFPYNQLIRKIKEQAICPEPRYSPIRSRSSTPKSSPIEYRPRRFTSKTSSPPIPRRFTAKKKSSRRSRTPELKLKVKKRRSISR